MAEPCPTMSLYLHGNTSIQLGRKGYAGRKLVLDILMHDKANSATLVIPGYKSKTRQLDLQLALQSGIFDLYDGESRAKVSVPQQDVSIEQLLVKAGAPTRGLELKLDPQDEFWAQLLTPGHTYKLSLAKGDNELWAYRGEVRQNEPERLPIYLGEEHISCTVLDKFATPLLFSVSVSPTDNVCHMSGSPRFGFKLEVTSRGDDIVTVCLNSTPLKGIRSGEDVVEVEDEDCYLVDWDSAIGCTMGLTPSFPYSSPEPFPSDGMFEEFKPGVPYETTFWMDDPKSSDMSGDLSDFSVGKTYTAYASAALLCSFRNVSVGRKEEILVGSSREKEQRWNTYSREEVLLDVSEPFTFATV